MPQKIFIHNNKLTHSLRVLSPDELKSLGKWLQSPWANSNTKVYELYLLLKKYAPTYDSPQLNRESIFNKLYPTKPFNDRWLRNIMAELNKQIESFMIHQRLEKEEDLKKMLLAKEYEKRHQTKRLLKLAEGFNEQLEAKKDKGLEDYYYGCFLNDLVYYSPETSAQWKGEKPLLNQADAYLDQFYLLAKWRYRSEFKERQRLLKKEEQPLFDLEILEKIGEHISIPAVNLYDQKRRGGDHLSEDEFEKLKEDYFECFDFLSFKDQQIFYFYLLNILIKLHLKGQSNVLSLLFSFYMKGVEQSLIIHQNRLSHSTYTNIIIAGINVKQPQSVLNFIASYTPFLKKEEQHDGQTWGTARYHFYNKEYEEIIRLLRDHKFSIPSFERRGRTLLLQTYFELLSIDQSYISLFFYFNQTFTRFIQRDKTISLGRKKAYLSFLKYTRKIADLIISKKKTSSSFVKVLQDIENESTIQGKQWLKEKLNILIEK